MRRWLAIAAAAVVATLPVVPVLVGYHSRQAAYGLVRGYGEIVSMSAGVQGVAGISHRAVLWVGWLPNAYNEGALFPGFAIVMLGAIGVVASMASPDGRTWRRTILFYLAGAVVMWVLTLGPEVRWSGVRVSPRYGPYWLLLQLPGAQSIRVPARAWLLATLCLAVCAGFGAAWLARRSRTRWLVALFALMIVAEGWFAADTVAAPMAMPFFVPAGAMVLDLPLGADYENADAQYLAVLGTYRVVNGYSGYFPPYFQALRNALTDHRPEAFAPFRALTDLYVVVRSDVDPPSVAWLEMQPGIQHVLDIGTWRIYQLPHEGSGLPRPLPLPLPGPGQAPFAIP